jgi:hypothetical protein
MGGTLEFNCSGRSSTMTPVSDSDGILLAQRYRLGSVVRESPVAIVYEARHRNGVDAWIKVPRGPEHAGAIAIEARVANALAENAVNVRDDGTGEDGLPYLVLEPVTGQRLDHWRDLSGGRAPPDEALGLGDELCRAMEIMHAAGFALGLLRPDAILVLPTGGVCLLELEHAKPATAAAIREDALRVGRVLYEALSGVAAIGQFAPLGELLPELPRALTRTVDAAARGSFASVGELRAALHRSSSEWPGEVRRPMPSVVPEMLDPADVVEAEPSFAGDTVRLPPLATPMFDPRELADEIERPPRPSPPPEVALASPSHRPSAGDLEPPPIAAFERVPVEPVARPGAIGGILAAVFGVGVLAASLALVVFAAGKDDAPFPRPPAPKAAAPLAIRPVGTPSTIDEATPAASANAPSPAVLELDDGPAAIASGAASLRDAGDPAAVTAFTFEGSLSPRLVIVDGVVVGVTTKDVRVRCGTHAVRIGGKGAVRTLDLPCADEQRIVIESNGAWRAEPRPEMRH